MLIYKGSKKLYIKNFSDSTGLILKITSNLKKFIIWFISWIFQSSSIFKDCNFSMCSLMLCWTLESYVAEGFFVNISISYSHKRISSVFFGTRNNWFIKLIYLSKFPLFIENSKNFPKKSFDIPLGIVIH